MSNSPVQFDSERVVPGAQPFVVVLGASPTGLYVVRELGAEGVTVGVVSEGRQCGLFSKYVRGPKLTIDGISNSLVEQLLKIARDEGRRGVLFPSSDQFVEFVSRWRAELAVAYNFIGDITPDGVGKVVNKGAFLVACREAGVEAPGSFEHTFEELYGSRDQLRFPILIKPSLIHRVKAAWAGRKAIVVERRQQFRNAVDELPRGETTWLVQEVVPGPESNISLYGAYLDKLSRPHQGFTARKLRQYPPGFGSASLVVSEHLSETKELSEHLLSAIRFHGVAGVEFKRDPRDGRLKVIEVNARPTLWFEAAHTSGKRIALAAYRDCAGLPLLDEHVQQEGVLWRYAWKDLYSATYYALHGGVSGLPPPVLGDLSKVSGRTGPVFRWDDPLPAAGEAANFGSKVWARNTRRFQGRKGRRNDD